MTILLEKNMTDMIVQPVKRGTEYRVKASDLGTLIPLANGVKIVMPSDLEEPSILTGSVVTFYQYGSKQSSFVGNNAVLNYTPGNKTRNRYSAVMAVKTAANTWLLVGDLTP